MNVAEILRRAREQDDFGPLCAVIPYARFLNLSLEIVDGELRGTMRFIPTNVGNPVVGALHGGTLGALLEFTAIGHVLRVADSSAVPKTINLTVEYLRSAALVDTFARCSVERLGKRIAVIRAVAWQEDPGKPVAAATVQMLIAADAAEEGES